jgi:hypothetical protein
MIDLILRIIITLILAGLESLGPAEPTPPPSESAPPQSEASTPPDAVPIARGREPAAAVLGLLRAVDPCGLHDLAAATRVAGHRADQILPTESLAECRLRLHRAPGEPTWTLTTRVGVNYGPAARQAAVLEEVQGRRVYRDESRDPHARSCTYTRPMGADHGISLTAEAPLGEPNAKPCPVARAYLTAARPLTHLVLRLEKKTEPRFALAAVDPCAATGDILRKLGVSGVAHPEAPYRCHIQPDPNHIDPDPEPPVTISFGIGADPAELVGAGTGHHVVTVADHTGIAVLVGPEPHRCELTLGHDTDVAIPVNHTRLVQTISIGAASCGQATTVAEAVVHTIATR